MPILARKNEVVIALTHQCNWNCEYCAVRNSRDQATDTSIQSNLEKLSHVIDHQTVTFTGGEIGTLDKREIELYISTVRTKKGIELFLETNGLFLQRYPDLAKDFDCILYHCSQDLQLSDNIIRIKHDNVRYLLVVNDLNFVRLEDFLKKNSGIKFDIIEATYPHEQDGRVTLSSENKNFILCNLSSYMTKESVERLIKGKNFEAIKWYM